MHVIFDVRFLLFFFSSRRRHTRWPRDWSSDVCSSDLSERLYREVPKFSPSREGILLSEHVFKIGRASCRESVDLGGRSTQQKKKQSASSSTLFTFRHNVTPSAHNF